MAPVPSLWLVWWASVKRLHCPRGRRIPLPVATSGRRYFPDGRNPREVVSFARACAPAPSCKRHGAPKVSTFSGAWHEIVPHRALPTRGTSGSGSSACAGGREAVGAWPTGMKKGPHRRSDAALRMWFVLFARVRARLPAHGHPSAPAESVSIIRQASTRLALFARARSRVHADPPPVGSLRAESVTFLRVASFSRSRLFARSLAGLPLWVAPAESVTRRKCQPSAMPSPSSVQNCPFASARSSAAPTRSMT